MINDTSRCSVATSFRCGRVIDQYSVANLLLNMFEKIFKSLDIWQRYGENLIVSGVLCVGTLSCTRLRSDICREGTVVTASRYDWYCSLTLTP